MAYTSACVPACLPVHRYTARHPPRQAHSSPRDTPASQLPMAAFTDDMRCKGWFLKLRLSPLVWTTLRWDIVNAACGSIFVLCSRTFLQMCQQSVVFYMYHIIWPVMPRLRERDNKRMQFMPWLWLLLCSSRPLCSFPSSGFMYNLPYFLLCKFKNSRERKK